MNLHSLQPAKGSVKSNKRLGRGQGSTDGGTSGRGHKGAKSRSGYSRKRGFEGGQMPMQRRLPKYGFTNFNRVEYKAINLDTLQRLADKGITNITPDVLYENGLIHKNSLVKILAKGEIKTSLDVHAHAFSKTAEQAILAANGKVVKLASE
jgi:large subunit ribosomal protein L15